MQMLSEHKKLQENYIKMKIRQEISKLTTCANNICKQTCDVVWYLHTLQDKQWYH